MSESSTIMKIEYGVSISRNSNAVDGLKHLVQDVDQLMLEGWKLQGGISIAVDELDYVFAQAIVRTQD